MRTREEHLQWCKDNALEYWRAGDLENAVASMLGDLKKHPETEAFNDYILALGVVYVTKRDYEGVHRWIVGFR
jgi:hypothetical protein